MKLLTFTLTIDFNITHTAPKLVCAYVCRMNLCLVKELGDRAAQGRAYGNLGNTHYLLGNFVEAIKFHRQVRNLKCLPASYQHLKCMDKRYQPCCCCENRTTTLRRQCDGPTVLLAQGRSPRCSHVDLCGVTFWYCAGMHCNIHVKKWFGGCFDDMCTCCVAMMSEPGIFECPPWSHLSF